MGLCYSIFRYLLRHSCFIVSVTVFIIFVLACYVPTSYQPTGRNIVGNSVAPGATNENLFYFVQVSDIHLSKFHQYRYDQLFTFCNETIPIISPEFVINTGDISDSIRDPSMFFYMNEQNIEEWNQYQEILSSAGYYNKSFWLDIKGNHDMFAVKALGAPNNYYKSFGVYGDEDQYTFVSAHSFGSYQFVSIDLTFELGASSPYQFFGKIPKSFDEFKESLENSNNYNHTIVFGHYPRVTSFSNFPWEILSKNKVISYLCGHLHSAKMVKRMSEGHYELELEDMKIHKSFRLLAFDHDLFSFIDTQLSTWPLILITNPKDARFFSDYEPLDLIAESTHIRVLVFSNSSILSVKIQIDDQAELEMQKVGDGPLYVLPWNPKEFIPGLHLILVTAADESGSQSVSHQFSTNKTPASLPSNLMQDAVELHVFLQITFAFLYVYSILFLFIFPKIYVDKFWNIQAEPDESVHILQIPETREETFKSIVKEEFRRQFITYGSLTKIQFWILFTFWINLGIGVLTIGPMVDLDTYGVAFSWGIVANNRFSPAVESLIIAWALLIIIYLPSFHLLTNITVLNFQLNQMRSRSYFRLPTRLLSVSSIFDLIAVIVLFPFSIFLILKFQTWITFLLSPSLLWYEVCMIIIISLEFRKWRNQSKSNSINLS